MPVLGGRHFEHVVNSDDPQAAPAVASRTSDNRGERGGCRSAIGFIGQVGEHRSRRVGSVECHCPASKLLNDDHLD